MNEDSGLKYSLGQSSLPARQAAEDKDAQLVKRRPGGRTERNRSAVASAVLRLIGGGRLDFELQEVAELSGVHRTTIFRRWPDRTALIAEAMLEHTVGIHVNVTRDWRADLRRVAFQMRGYFSDPVELAINRVLAVTDNDDVLRQMEEYYNPVWIEFAKPIVAAQERGEVSVDAKSAVIIQMMVSTMIVLTMFTRTPVSDDMVNAIADQAIRACEGR